MDRLQVMKSSRYYLFKNQILNTLDHRELMSVIVSVRNALNARSIKRDDLNMDRNKYMRYSRLMDKIDYNGAMIFFLCEIIYYNTVIDSVRPLLSDIFGNIKDNIELLLSNDGLIYRLGNEIYDHNDILKQELCNASVFLNLGASTQDTALGARIHMALIDESIAHDYIQSFITEYVDYTDLLKENGVIQSEFLEYCDGYVLNYHSNKIQSWWKNLFEMCKHIYANIP